MDPAKFQAMIHGQPHGCTIFYMLNVEGMKQRANAEIVRLWDRAADYRFMERQMLQTFPRIESMWHRFHRVEKRILGIHHAEKMKRLQNGIASIIPQLYTKHP